MFELSQLSILTLCRLEERQVGLAGSSELSKALWRRMQLESRLPQLTFCT